MKRQSISKTLTLAAAFLTAGFVRAADPTSEATATSLRIPTADSGIETVLVRDGTNELGVCYYKMTLSKGKQYTLWLDGESDASVAIETIYAQEDWSAPGAFFSSSVYGRQTRWVCTGEGWANDWGDFDDDDDDWGGDWDFGDAQTPSSWTYYLVVRGPVGATARLHAGLGVLVPVGTVANPLVITMKPTVQTNTVQFVENQYTVSVSLKGGCRYYVGVTGGTADHELLFSGLPGMTIANYMPWDSDHNDSRVFLVEEDMTCVFSITDSNPAERTAAVQLFYRVDSARTIAEHAKTATALTVGQTVESVPGYKNNPAYGAYDPIVDDCLYSFKAEKNAAYLIETDGASVPIELIVYDAKGNVLSSNRTKGGQSLDARCTLETTAAGTYYVGLCEDMSPVEEYAPRLLPVNLTVRKVESTGRDAAPELVVPQIGAANSPAIATESVAGPYVLDGTTWYRNFAFRGRKGMSYVFGVSQDADLTEESDPDLAFTVYTLSGKTEKTAMTAEIHANSSRSHTLLSEQDTTYYVRIAVANSVGCDFNPFRVHLVGFPTGGGGAGILTVRAGGADAALWSLGSEAVKYGNGESLLLAAGTYVVKYAAVSGFSTPNSRTVSVTAGETLVIDGDFYSDTADPKDDDAKTATAWTLKTVETSFRRTLWPGDPADHFAFAGADGCYYDFELRDATCDASFSITNAELGVVVSGMRNISKIAFPKTKSKYILRVVRNASDAAGGSYTLAGRFANVGSVRFARTAVTAREDAPSVSLTVNRTAKEGMVRVRYNTVAGTAEPGVDYVAQSGVLEWAAGDNQAKTITVKLIPDLVATWEGNKTFTVSLEPAVGSEYWAQILGGDACTVTLTEVSRAGTTAASTYAAKAPKAATTKTEVGALRGGTFYGIVQAAAGGLTNGLPELASVTLTVSAKGGVDDSSKDTISAKVLLAGKTYAFKTASKEAAWNEEDPQANPKTKTLVLTTKVANVAYANTLELSVFDGSTTDETAWMDALAEVRLTMNVPDANNKGVQRDVVYTGRLYRQNAKIQAYLDAVLNFAGYYTVALANPNTDERVAPAGHGYCTLTIDNKGTAKVAGLLADGTKLSFSVVASAVQPDCCSAGGLVLRVPLFAAKSPYCFGGEILLQPKPIDGVHPDGKDFDIVATLPEDGGLVWNNDNAALTYSGAAGWSLDLQPVGGWYDTVFNLQTYYRNYALSVATADISEFPTEALTDGYAYVTGAEADQQPNGIAVDLQGNAFATEKKVTAKSGTLTDLVGSTNPYNVQLKLARATGIVTGSFSLWSYNAAQNKQKEISGIKHNGIVLLQRGESDILNAADLTAGFFNQTVKVPNGTKTRNWTVSMPFNVRLERTGE
ncbi:MAG: Calx-beta domain-containing protein [Kiritimatiellia bacterium]